MDNALRLSDNVEVGGRIVVWFAVELDTTDDQNMKESQIRPFWKSDPHEFDTCLDTIYIFLDTNIQIVQGKEKFLPV